MKSNTQIIGPENQYQIFLDKMIGQGSYGSVFECTYSQGRQTIMPFCAKITAVQPSNKQSQQNTKREEQILKIVKANPNNFNLVKVEYVQFFEKEAKLVVIMEKCDMNFKEMINQKQKFSDKEIFDFLQQFIVGYQALYDSNIIHRDIKPENILIKKKLNGEPQYKLADFGVGKIYKQNDFYLTRVGTPIYSPPEVSTIYKDQQLDDELSYMKDKKCVIDMYSLGIILYQLTFCGLPFQPTVPGIRSFFQQIKVQPFKPPSNLGKNQELLDLIEQLLIYNPSKRLNFDQLQKKLQRQTIINIIPSTNLAPQFQEVKQYLLKQLILNQNFLNNQQKMQIQSVLAQQQWNQAAEWLYDSFSFQSLQSQLYNDQDLSFFFCLKCLKNKQAFQLPKSRDQIISFLSK